MRKINIIYKSKINLAQEHHNTVLHKIELVNLARIKIMMSILFVIQIMFITFNDLKYLIQPAGDVVWKDARYFVVHLLLLSTSIIGYITANKFTQTDIGKWKQVYYYFTPVILAFYLILNSVLNVLDQLHIKNDSNLFIANLLICGGLFMIKFPKNLCFYAIPFLFYIGLYIYVDIDPNILYVDVTNNIIFFVAIIIISTSIYNYQYKIIANNISLDQANNQLNYISNHDLLTGLLNRRCFLEQVEKKRDGKLEPDVIVLMDIDYFKNVNDNYGHPIGDIVLKDVSTILLKYIKGEDMAVRWGGEEFLLYLSSTSMEEAYALMDNIRKSIQELMVQVRDYKIQVTASFGMAEFHNVTDISYYSAYKAADLALYQAKSLGRNCIVKGV